MIAKIRNGKWCIDEERELDPVQLFQLHHQLGKIHDFAQGVELSYDKIEILSHILNATPLQENAILKILKMDDRELRNIF